MSKFIEVEIPDGYVPVWDKSTGMLLLEDSKVSKSYKLNKSERKRISASARNKAFKSFQTEVNRLRKAIKEYSEESAHFRLKYRDTYDKLLEAESKIKEQEDWIRRLLGYLDYQDKEGYKECKELLGLQTEVGSKPKAHRSPSFLYKTALELMGIVDLS